MDFDYSADQQLLMDSFETLLDRHGDLPQGQHGHVVYGADLAGELSQSGFLDLLAQDDFGLLEGALLVEAAARRPIAIEVAGSLLVAPLLKGAQAPLALAWGLSSPVRYLPVAKSVCVIEQDRVAWGNIDPGMQEAVDSVAAYPLAFLRRRPDDSIELAPDIAHEVRLRALVGIAAEAAGLMRGALDNTIAYVKTREQFGHPLGDFQAIQHRLAEDEQLVRTSRWLALRAADSGALGDASTACLFAQDAIRKLVTDCHQFSGAMGLTLEFPLHLWTYRMKMLQGEGGGIGAHGRMVAECVWPEAQAM